LLLLLLLSPGCRGPSFMRARAELPKYPLTIVYPLKID